LLGWVLFGYYIWLFLLTLIKKDPDPVQERFRTPPLVSYIIPVYNEEDRIAQKIANLKALEYPKDKLQVIFVDGGSEDGTLKAIARDKDQSMEVISSPLRGKTHQINYALKHCRGEIIFISDADGITSLNTVSEVLKEFESDRDICLVGVYSHPEGAYELDRYYWLAQNKGRLLETSAFTSSIVVAICYAFRKGLLGSFPDDVVADDVYISYYTNNLGKRVSYIDKCFSIETRSPSGGKQFFSHKFRKSNAFLKESLRFVYKTAEMNPRWKIMFITKVSQLLFTPWLMALYIAIGGSLVSLGRWDIFLIGTIPLFIMLLVTSKIFAYIPVREDRKHYPLAIVVKTFLISTFILLLCGITFTFFRQDSNYRKTDAA